jgi:hypothetical protein
MVVFVVPDMLPALMMPVPITAMWLSTVTSASATLVIKVKAEAAAVVTAASRNDRAMGPPLFDVLFDKTS